MRFARPAGVKMDGRGRGDVHGQGYYRRVRYASVVYVVCVLRNVCRKVDGIFALVQCEQTYLFDNVKSTMFVYYHDRVPTGSANGRRIRLENNTFGEKSFEHEKIPFLLEL